MKSDTVALLFLDSLPLKISKGTILRLLIEQGGLNRSKVGQIDLRGRQATIEVPPNWLPRLIRAIDGTPLNNHHIRAWSQTDATTAEGQTTGARRGFWESISHS